MKKPIEVGQRVAVWANGIRVGKGVVFKTLLGLEFSYAVKFDDGGYIENYTRENLRVLKPKPKRVCHCNREPDRWVAFNTDGVFVCSGPTIESIMKWVRLDGCKYVAPCWFGLKEEVK